MLTKHGEWKDYDPLYDTQPSNTDAATDRRVSVVVPAPYELEGRTYPAKSFNLEQLLPGKAGEMFSFCGYNGSFTSGDRGTKRGGNRMGHHMCIKFDITERKAGGGANEDRQAPVDEDEEELSQALTAGECIVRLPLADIVSGNTLHFRELLINGSGVPVTDAGLDGTSSGVYAEFKVDLVGSEGFHHQMKDSFNAIMQERLFISKTTSQDRVKAECSPPARTSLEGSLGRGPGRISIGSIERLSWSSQGRCELARPTASSSLPNIQLAGSEREWSCVQRIWE